MERTDPGSALLKLLLAFLEIEAVPEFIMLELERRAEFRYYERNEVVHEEGQPSTHAYFIVDGIMMCYVKDEQGHDVKWFRSTGDYAYSMDMSRTFSGLIYTPARNTLIALEDMAVFKITHEDVKWLEDNSQEMRSLLQQHLIHYNQISLGKRAFEHMDAANRYQFMQRHMNVSLERIPDIYLSSFLNLTLPEIKKVKISSGSNN